MENEKYLSEERYQKNNKKVIKKLSKDYYSMEPIYEEGLKELYIVCNAVCDIVYSQFLEYLKNFDDFSNDLYQCRVLWKELYCI